MKTLLKDDIRPTCSVCGAQWADQIYSIIQISQQENVTFKSLRQILACPNGHEQAIDAAFLVYQPDRQPSVLFIPAEGANAEQDEEDRKRLNDALIQALQEAGENPDSLTLAVVFRPCLPLFLADEDAVRALAPILQRYLLAPNAEQASAAVSDHPSNRLCHSFVSMADIVLNFIVRWKYCQSDEWAQRSFGRRKGFQGQCFQMAPSLRCIIE